MSRPTSEQTPETLLNEIIDLLDLDTNQNFGGEWIRESYPADDINDFVHARLETTEGETFGVRVRLL